MKEPISTDTKVLAVSLIKTSPEFVAGKPVELFEGPYSSDSYRPGFDVWPFGQRFVMVKVPEGSAPPADQCDCELVRRASPPSIDQ